MGFGRSTSNQASSSTGSSSNQAYPFLQNSLGSQVGLVGSSSSAISDILGLSGNAAQTQGFDRYRESAGYNFTQSEGVRGIAGNASARGLLNSGSTAKEISRYSSNLASTYLDSYLQRLSGLGNTGLQAGSVIGGSGNTSSNQSTSTGTSSSRNIQLG